MKHAKQDAIIDELLRAREVAQTAHELRHALIAIGGVAGGDHPEYRQGIYQMWRVTNAAYAMGDAAIAELARMRKGRRGD